MEIKIDKEFSELIPPLTEEEFKGLEESVIKEGCRDALVVWDNTLVDGHNRYKICQRHTIPFNTIEKNFETREDAIVWIIHNQFGRRNLIPAARCELALCLQEIIQRRAKENLSKGGQNYSPKEGYQNSDKVTAKIHTDKELGKIAGVSHNTIFQYKKVKKEGDDEISKKMQKGEISVYKAYNITTGKEENKSKTPELATTKKCSKCGVEKLKAEFYEGRGACKDCFNSISKTKDIKGNIIKSNFEVNKLANEHMENITKTLCDVNREIIITSDDLVEDLQSFSGAYIRNVERCLVEYRVLISKENKQKISAILLEVEKANKKLKEIISHE